MLGIFKLFSRKKSGLSKLEKEIESLKESLAQQESASSEKDGRISALSAESQQKENALCECRETISQLEQNIQRSIAEMEQKDKDIESRNEKLAFLAQVINARPEKNEASEKFRLLLNEDYMDYANKNDSLAGEAEALRSLQKVSEQLKLLSYDKSLLNKTIVAIAGSFSSGKSSFMNSFFTTRNIKLPTGMDQTTAISSYVMNGEESITGCSYKGGRVSISNSVFKLFSYGKVEEFNFNMKQLINHIVFRNELVKEFNNLCFIDTPGFNPGQETETDYNTATTAISTAGSIIWCIDGSAGTIKGDECDILSDIFKKNEKNGIYVVINKADLKSPEEMMSVMDEVENQLNDRFIPYEGISLYSSRNKFTEQPEEYNFFKGISLAEFLEKNNVENTQKEESLLAKIDGVFEDYINADNRRIEKLDKQIRMLKILEKSFSSINDSKDEQISYYKARMDTKHYKQKQFEDSTDKDDELFDSLADLKNELKQTIEKDKSDIEQAKDLCLNMKKAVAEMFGHTLAANKKTSEAAEVRYCNACGAKNKPDAQFCAKCGKEFL